MLFYKSYKYRLKPTKEQAAMIESAFSARRFIWNRFLERISKAYKRRGEDCLRDERVEPLQGVPRLHGVVRGACGRPDGGHASTVRGVRAGRRCRRVRGRVRPQGQGREGDARPGGHGARGCGVPKGITAGQSRVPYGQIETQGV